MGDELATLADGLALGRVAALRKEALDKTPHAWHAAMKGVFKAGVPRPPSGLQLASAKLRCATAILSLARYFPAEVLRIIIITDILQTPHYGMDIFRFFRWFWKQPSVTFPWVIFRGDPYTTPPKTRELMLAESDVHTTFGRKMHHGLGANPDGTPDESPTRKAPTKLHFSDLSGIFIGNISGSAMAHRTWGGLPGEEGGTARWYPEDWDVFLFSPQAVYLFELWLEAVFRRVVFLPKRGEEETTARASDFDEYGRFLRRGGRTPAIRSWKWKIGPLTVNAVIGTTFVDRYDFEPAATASTPPFDTIYQSFAKNYCGEWDVVMHSAREDDFYRKASRVGIILRFDAAEQLDLGRTMRARHLARLAKYRKRYPTVDVVTTCGHAKMFWYCDFTFESMMRNLNGVNREVAARRMLNA